MQPKAIKRIVKAVKRRFSHGKHKHTDSATTTPSSSRHPSLLHDDSFSPPTLTVPASPRSGSSSQTLGASPQTKTIDICASSTASSEGVMSAHSHPSELSTTNSDLVTAESGPSEPAQSMLGLSDMVDAGHLAHSDPVRETVDSESHDDPSMYGSARQSMATSTSQEGMVELAQSSELQPLAEETGEGPLVVSHSPIVVEPDVPDPFIVDDSGNSASEEDASSSQAEDIPLAQSTSLSASDAPASVALSSPNVNKDVLPPPPVEEEESHDLYLPGLVMPTMFLPIPNTDPLTTLLTKYISPSEKRPVRDVTGDWQHTDFHTMVMSNSWRPLARMARDRLVTSNPEDLNLVLGLWYLRLSSLSRLRLYNQTSAECTNLFTVLNAIEPPSARAWLFDRILPFELEVMFTRLKYWTGDHMGYLDALSGLLKKSKAKARQNRSDPVALMMWQERRSRICLIVASQFMEMKEYIAAAKLLEPLCDQPNNVTSPALQSSVARIYLQGGYLAMASKHFEAVNADPTAEQPLKDMNAALLASAQGDWSKASDVLKTVLADDPENFVAANNLSVALLSQGKIKEGIEILEAALASSPSTVVVAEPFLFNLSTLYELRSAAALDRKRDLLVEVARWSGDGLKTACLKMPSN